MGEVMDLVLWESRVTDFPLSSRVLMSYIISYVVCTLYFNI